MQRLAAANPRDGVSFSTLSDWSKPALFDPGDGHPLWDSYTVYYATLETPGRLVKQVYTPAGAPFVNPMAGFSAVANTRDDPSSNLGVIQRTSVLAAQVEVLRLQAGSDSLQLRLLLGAQSGRRFDGNGSSQERLEMNFTLKQENTGQ